MTDAQPSSAGVAPPSRDLNLPVLAAAAFVVVAVALSVFQLFTAGVRPVGLFYQRGLHLAAVEILAFLVFLSRGR